MKKNYLIGIFFLFLSCENPVNSIKEDNKNIAKINYEKYNKAPIIEFENKIYKFGEIKYNEEYEHKFRFKNKGKSPLIIINVKVSCGCTIPEYSKEPVEPNEEGFIKIIFKPNSKGVQSKMVYVSSNSKNGEDRLNIRAKVK